MTTATEILCNNPQSMMKAFQKGAFLCVAAVGMKSRLCFNETMLASAPANTSVAKMAAWAKKNGCSDATHTIYHVTPSGNIFEYSIQNN